MTYFDDFYSSVEEQGPPEGYVQFYQDGQWFVFLDRNKKEHKFALLHMEKLP